MTESKSINKSLGQKIAGGATWVIGSRMAVRLIGVISTLILARLLLPADFGLIALATLIYASIELLSAFNFDVWLIHHPKPNRDHYNTVWTLNIIRGLLTTIALVLLAYPASLFFDQPRLNLILLALAGGSFILSFINVGIVDFRKHLEFNKEFILLTMSKIASFLITIAVAYTYRSYWALVAGIISGNILKLALSYIMHSFRPRLSLIHWKEAFHFSKWLLTANFLSFVYTRSDTFIFGKLLNAQFLGLYTVAHEIATLTTSEVVAPIRQVLLPGYSKMSDDIDLMRKSFLDGLGIILLIGIPCSLGIGLLADPLVRVLLGDKWLESIPLIRILVIYGMASVAMANQSPLLVALGHTRLVSQLLGLGVLILLPIFIWATLESGIQGGAWALGLTNCLLFIISLFATLRVLKLSIVKVFGTVWRILSASIAMLALVLLIQQWSVMQTLEPFAQLFIFSICGALTYTGSLLVLWNGSKRPDGPEKTIVDFISDRFSTGEQHIEQQTTSKNVKTDSGLPRNRGSTHCSVVKENVLFKKILSFLPTTLIKFIEERQSLFLCLRIALLLGTYLVFNRIVPAVSHLPEASYQQPWLLITLLQNMGVSKICLSLLLFFVLVGYGSLLSPWKVLNYAGLLRGFIVFLAFLMAWAFSTQGYNYYFDQGYFIDRLMIILMLPLLWWRPVFIYPFLFLCYTIMWQWVTPTLGGSILMHKLQVMKILNIFAAMWLLHGLTGSRRSNDFIFLACCMIAAAYWDPALAKLELDWLSYGHLNHALLAAYGHGWLGMLDSSSVVELAHILAGFDRPMQWYVIAIEAGCLVFLWRPSLSVFLLINLTLFHAAVFAIYGFLFWPWMLLNLSMLVLLLKIPRHTNFNIFSRSHFILSILLIGFANQWASPSHLGWLDTRLSYTTEYTATAGSGQEYKLSPRFFEPYGDVFAMSSFSYLVKQHKFLAGAYGVSMNREVADRLSEPVTSEQLLMLEQELGENQYNASRAERHYKFLRRYLHNWNKRQSYIFNPADFAPPHQFWNLRRLVDQKLMGDEVIKQLEIVEVTRLYDDKSLQVVRRKKLAGIDIPSTRTE